MIGTWEILESGKGGGVGRKIPLPTDWRKNLESRGHPRMSRATHFTPRVLHSSLFRNFPQEALASYNLLERDLLCRRV